MVVNRISYALHRWILFMKKNCFPLAETVLEQDFMRITIITYYLWSAKLQVLFLLKSIQNSNLLFTRIASTDETNQATINLSDLEHGIYEIYSTVGTFCKIGYSNGKWWLPEKTSENTTISGEILNFDAGSWYAIIYIRKISKFFSTPV